jgi:hypothetical protein
LYYVNICDVSSTRSTDLSRKFDFLIVIEHYINYLEKNDLNQKVKFVFFVHIARCVNSLLSGTFDSADVFIEAISRLKKIERLKYYVYGSKSLFHILEYKMIKYPKTLQFLLKKYYKLS